MKIQLLSLSLCLFVGACATATATPLAATSSVPLAAIADVIVVFEDGGCAFTGPAGEIPNPVRVSVDNPTDADYALVIVTLEPGATRAQLESAKNPGIPPFVDQMIAHLDAGPGEHREWTVDLKAGIDHYFVCAAPEGVLAVPGVYRPGP